MSSRASKLIAAGALTVTATLVVGLAGYFAARTPGYASTSVHATQRAAWVTKADAGALGLLNQQTDELESPAFPDGSDFDLLQQGDTVVVFDRTVHTLQSLDTANSILSGKLLLPEKFDVALSGHAVAVSDETTGDLWVLPTVGLGNGDLTTVSPNGQSAPGAVLTINGTTVTAVAPGSDAMVTVQQNNGDGPAQVTTAAVPGGAFSEADAKVPDPVSITSVGAIPVALDSVAGRVVVANRSFDLPEDIENPVLQQPGPGSDTVLIATSKALLRVNLTSGEIRTQQVSQPGDPTAPVWAAGCAHGAWSGETPEYLAWCGSDAQVRPIANAAGSQSLKFRVNAETVVLNDTITGNVWVLDENLTLVNNWDEILVEKANVGSGPGTGEGKSDRTTTSRENCTLESTATPPNPDADNYGVRAGHPRTLPVLDNDKLSNCSVTVITSVTGPGVAGDSLNGGDEGENLRAADADSDGPHARIVDNGAAIQFSFGDIGQQPVQPVTLTYTVSDGLGNEASSEVTVNPVIDPEPVAPEKIEDSTTAVTVGGTVTEEVLSDWDSPSGDQLYLTKVEGNVPDDKVTFTSAGEITVVDAGTTGATKKTVSYWLSDGTNTAKGTLTINVEEPAKAEPLATPVHATGVVDTPIRIAPLESVFWQGEGRLALAEVERSRNSTGGLTLDTESLNDTVLVSAAEPGTYYLDYRVTAGEKEATGVIRVDVRAVPDSIPAPVAGTDVAYLPAGGETLVDLIANDIDPSGGIVAVQQISAGDSGLQIQLTGMHLAEISAARPLPAGGVWVPYTASAGGDSTTGWLHVVGVPQPQEALSPTASPIDVSVRAGDAVTIPVAKHAIDPTGALLTPVPFRDDAIDDGAGLLFSTAEDLRYQAPADGPVAEGKTLRTQYTVVNPSGKKASANLAITVVPAGDNTAPTTPPVLESRIFVGGTTDLDLPLQGIDPDGDWTILSSLDEAPTKGRAAPAGTSSLRYTAFKQPGLDTMTYTAADRFGGTTQGTVRILVVPLPKTAEPPVAPDLKVTIAPEAQVALNVIGEASDPAGLALDFVDKPIELAPNAGVTAEVRDDALVLTAGPDEKTATLRYTLQNSRKRTDTGTVTVTISKKAPKVPPKAFDVLVSESMLAADSRTATVDVSSWVANPGGMPEDLVAGVPTVSKGILTAVGKRTLEVPITEQRQIVAYQITNASKLTAQAFLIVPSRSSLNIDPPPAGGAPVAPQDPDPPAQKPEPTKRSAAPPSKSAAPKTSTPAPEVFKPEVLQSLTVDAGTTASVKVADYIGGLKQGRTLTIPEDAELVATQGTLTRADAETLNWEVPTEAGGEAQLTITVSDGVAKPVKTGIAASITPKQPDPPTIQSSQDNVEAGQEIRFELLPLVTYDPDKLDSLTFDGPSGGESGLDGRLEGNVLVVSAATAAAKGTQATFSVTVSDGINEPATGTFTVTVTGSTAPLATVANPKIEALAGQPTQVNVLEGSTNPFPQTGPLTLLHADQGENFARGEITADGLVTVTPNADFSGELKIGFVVGDASGDEERNVSGTLTVTVMGTPAVPGTPKKMEVGNGTATIQWEEPDHNGSQITGYVVKGKNFRQECPASPCTLEGLTNNVTYTFTVTAQNGVGNSEQSNPSAGIRPDTAPEAPATPKVTFGDSIAEVTWTAPANNGSPVTGYQLNISPAPADGPATIKLPADATAHTVTGLSNGTKYTMSVQARNDSDTAGEASPGASVVPAGAPGAPQNLTVSSADAAGVAKKIDVSWDPGTANGDPPGYVVSWTAGGEQAGRQELGADATATAIPAELGVTYTVSVTSKNKAAQSETVTSREVTPFTTPGAPETLTATAPGENQVVILNWPAAAGNGRPVAKYQYTTGTDGWKDAGGGDQTSFAPPGLTNGETYSFQIRACHEDGNCGKPSPVAEEIPYGPPGIPQNVTANADSAPGTIVLAWQPAGGNGREVAGYEYQIAGSGNWQNVGNATSVTLDGLTNGQNYSYEVRAYHREEAGKFGAKSPAVGQTPYGAPGAPTGLKVTRTGEDHQVQFEWTAGPDNGRKVTSHEYTTDGGQSWRGITNGGTNRKQSNGDDLKNGTKYTFQVRARTQAPQRNASPLSNSDPATPYGPISKVGNLRVSERTEKSVSFAWDAPASNGIGDYSYRVNGKDHGKKKSIKIDGSCGGTEITVTVMAIDSAGHQGAESTVKGKTKACPRNPQAKIWGWKSADGHIGTSPGSERCNGSSCIMIAIGVEDFKPNTAVHCEWNLGTSLKRDRDFTTNANGNWSEETKTYSGYRPLKVTCTGGGETKTATLN